ncbi:MAG: alpha/beta fold hydrolase [bacterium]
MKDDTIKAGRHSIRLSVFECGAGKPSIVFIPGSGCYAMLYADFLEALSRNGFNAVGIDLPGHGRSSGPRGSFRCADAISAVRAAAEYAQNAYNAPVGVAGSSLGGILALYSVAEIPLLKIALCHNVLDVKNPPLSSRREHVLVRARPFFPVLARLFPNRRVPLQAVFDWRLVFDDRRRLDELREDPLMVWSYTIATLNSLFIENKTKPEIENISSPVLVLVSGGDQILTEKYCRSVCERLGGKKEFVSIPEVGHMLLVEHIPAVLPRVLPWLGQTLKNSSE